MQLNPEFLLYGPNSAASAEAEKHGWSLDPGCEVEVKQALHQSLPRHLQRFGDHRKFKEAPELLT